MQDKQFDEDLNETERNACLSFKRIWKDFLGNHKAANYQDVVQDLFSSYEAVGCHISLKIQFLESLLDFFPENLVEFSDVYSERCLWKNSTKAIGHQIFWQNIAGQRGRMYLTPSNGERHKPQNFRGKYLIVS